MPPTKYEGLSYPTHFLKSRGNGIRNSFLAYRTKQVINFARRTVFIHFSVQIKQNLYSIGICRSPFVTQCMYSKSMKKNCKKSHFFKVDHFSISQQTFYLNFPPVYKHLLISSMRCACTPSHFSQRSNHQVAVEF